MSNLARRSLRTSAAAAGITALGVGFAGHAFAAPEAPAQPDSTSGGSTAPAQPAAGGVGNLLGDRSALPTPDMSELPPLFTFEMPTVTTNTAAPGTGPSTGPSTASDSRTAGLPSAESVVPEAPSSAPGTEALDQTLEGVTTVEGEWGQIQGPAIDPVADEDESGTMRPLETAGTVAGIADRAMSGGPLTSGNEIG
jgi:hypothetical protein